MDIRAQITNIQEGLMKDFEISRQVIYDLIANDCLNKIDIPSHKHLSYLLQHMGALKDCFQLRDYGELARHRSNFVDMYYLLQKKVQEIEHKIELCKKRFTSTLHGLFYLQDFSFVFSVMLLVNIWRLGWLYMCVRLDVIMRCTEQFNFNADKESQLETLFLCLQTDDLKLLVQRDGYSILPMQDSIVLSISEQMMEGAKEHLQLLRQHMPTNMVESMATSNIFDNLMHLNRQRSRMMYTMNFLNHMSTMIGMRQCRHRDTPQEYAAPPSVNHGFIQGNAPVDGEEVFLGGYAKLSFAAGMDASKRGYPETVRWLRKVPVQAILEASSNATKAAERVTKDLPRHWKFSVKYEEKVHHVVYRK
ncbi:uncharacterized protein LOC109606120 isoform X3 [Aethina tumida]|uniref:uncharacterized protein LOC109606120 isoform X1 n=1 Tax=Aethina tumida TaxID=116153 RepID=UPI002147FFA6|nr:uncharacterized protein LOC109606120 isoform X1 [Aethina tumida]XP_049822025.1 uncharacterized protein LOC109606120 isoform X2 [Aethina tumida]XP_049822026.1 uncharacterized protein LOC109606120 isoform X3 [Aethina tumida]